MMQQTYMQSMPALGTTVEFRVVASSVTDAEESFATLWKEVVNFEKRFTRFSVDSELSHFNAHAGEKSIISETFRDILEKALYFGGITDGLFNIFVLPSLQRAGYHHSMVTKDQDAPDYTQRDVLPYTTLEIGSDWARIPKNSALDLGGIGKGYLADYLSTCIAESIECYCLSIGGDIVTQGTDEQGNNWNIDIQSSLDREKNIAIARIDSKETRGIATSGMIREKAGQKQLHQINPNKEGVLDFDYDLASVIAHDATTADVIASMVLLGGKEFAEQMLDKKIIQAGLLQSKRSTTPLLMGKGFSLIQ